MDAHFDSRNSEATGRIGRLYNRLAELLRCRPGRLGAFREYCHGQEKKEGADVDQPTTRSD